jgi:hypothetical protein
MARAKSGDWRNPARIRAWAAGLAEALPTAKPGAAYDPPARSLWRLLAHGAAGWALCALVMGILLKAATAGLAVAIHAVAAPLIFALVAINYFRAHGARDPLPAALALTAVVAVLDAVIVAGFVLRSFSMFTSFAGTWLPFILIFLATWFTGSIMSMMPAPRNLRITVAADRDH